MSEENNSEPKINVKDAFDFILAEAKDEEYEQCSANALDFISACNDVKRFKGNPEAEALLPYARYFKLFSEAYRTWQISYDYTPIRSRFRLAYIALERDLGDLASKRKKASTQLDKDNTLLPAFKNLSEMLCEYTRCENSFINNDPFALADHSEKALEFESNILGKNLPRLERETGNEQEVENDKLALLIKNPSEDTVESCQKNMAEWLIGYLTTNQYLHDGLNACALFYIKLLQKRCNWTDDEASEFKKIEDITLKELQKRSPELSSELNAHVRHIKKHNQRLIDEPNLVSKNKGFLQITKGKLVLQMSAAFNAELAHELFTDEDDEKQTIFKDEIDREFHKLGVETSSYQMKQLQDVFQTSFGEKLLKEMSFDIWKKKSPDEQVNEETESENDKSDTPGSDAENNVEADESGKEITINI